MTPGTRHTSPVTRGTRGTRPSFLRGSDPFLGPGKKDPGISWSGKILETPNPFLGPGKKEVVFF